MITYLHQLTVLPSQFSDTYYFSYWEFDLGLQMQIQNFLEIGYRHGQIITDNSLQDVPMGSTSFVIKTRKRLHKEKLIMAVYS